MTRTGLLFPEESKPANEGFSGFGGGSSSTSTSRRGSVSSVSSTTSFGGGSTTGSTASSAVDVGNQFMISGAIFGTSQYINQPVFTISEEERRRKLNPALMVLTHPELEAWHEDAIRKATGEYGIGIIFVPLFKIDAEHDYELEKKGKDKLRVLRPLDPRTISEFASFDALRAAAGGVDGREKLKYGKGKEGYLEEMVLEVDVGGSVEEIVEEVVRGVTELIGI
ncbi:MAG: hypothetical protein MMC33_010859 [Icmadophila ericetorum]|nr:hypothetical protein [Icmadophila ericetorum]